MKILIIGASGMVGSRILAEALERGHDVIAAVRSPKKIAAHDSVVPVAVDINKPETVIPHAQKVDVVISSVSPRNSDDPHKDAAAIVNTLIEIYTTTKKRILMVGGGASLHTADGTPIVDLIPKEMVPEASSFRKAYGTLVQADIDFTFLAPGGMIKPGSRTGKFRLGGRTIVSDDDGNMSSISPEDYAIAMLDEAETPMHFRTIFNVAY